MKKYMLLLPMMISLGFVSLGFSQSQVLPKPFDISKEIQTGHNHKAEELLKEVLQKDKKLAKVHYMLSQVYYTKGEYNRALNELNIAKKLDPTVSFTNRADFKHYKNDVSYKAYIKDTLKAMRDTKSSNDEDVKDAMEFLLLLLVIGIIFAAPFM